MTNDKISDVLHDNYLQLILDAGGMPYFAHRLIPEDLLYLAFVVNLIDFVDKNVTIKYY